MVRIKERLGFMGCSVMFGYAPGMKWKREDGLLFVLLSNCIELYNKSEMVRMWGELLRLGLFYVFLEISKHKICTYE